MKYLQAYKYGVRLKNGRIPAEFIGRPRLVDRPGIVDMKEVIIERKVRDRRIRNEVVDIAYTSSCKRHHEVIENVEHIYLVMSEAVEFAT
jgi:hypothetical protein